MTAHVRFQTFWRAAGLLVLLAALMGCGAAGNGGSSGGAPTEGPTPTMIPFTPPPTNPPVAAALENPTDPLTIVLGGYFGNGGYWQWNDIANLLGVYSSYNAFVTTTVNGQDYTGVPLTYLFNYARLNTGALSMTVFTRSGQYTFQTRQLNTCEACLIARLPDDTLALVLPDQQAVIAPLVRIDAR